MTDRPNHSPCAFRLKRLITSMVFWAAIFLLVSLPRDVRAFEPGDALQIAAAFFTHMAVHESGHYIMGHMGGAHDVHMDFFTQNKGNIYLGVSMAKGLNKESSLPYKIAGEAAASYHFEVALRSYRFRPTTYNRSLLFFSGTDFLWYSLYAFYIDGARNPHYDPVGISRETGISPEGIVGLAAFQTALNAYRAYSGNDTVVPYFALARDRAEFGIQLTF